MHTQGPWKLRRKGGNIVEAGPFKYFASFDGIQSGDELAANARLIAAAPDMLATLRECRKQLDTIIEDGMPTDWRMWRDDIDAIISKAA